MPEKQPVICFSMAISLLNEYESVADIGCICQLHCLFSNNTPKSVCIDLKVGAVAPFIFPLQTAYI